MIRETRQMYLVKFLEQKTRSVNAFFASSKITPFIPLPLMLLRPLLKRIQCLKAEDRQQGLAIVEALMQAYQHRGTQVSTCTRPIINKSLNQKPS
jgi:hypothetical protein